MREQLMSNLSGNSVSDYRYNSGVNQLSDFIGVEPSKKRKRRTSFTPQALEVLNNHFDQNTHPNGNISSYIYILMCAACLPPSPY